MLFEWLGINGVLYLLNNANNNNNDDDDDDDEILKVLV